MKPVLFVVFLLAGAPAAVQAQTAARTLTMSGQGEVKAVPDTVTLSAGVTSQAPTAAAALAQNSAHMRGIFAALQKLDIPDKNIQTANFSISPQMTGGDQPARVTGYQVNNQLSVRLDDAAQLGVVLDALAGAGANQMNGIDFAIRDTAPLLAQARAAAVTDARDRAETYAKAAGVALGPILSIGENGGDAPRPMYMAAPMVRAAKSVPVAAGEESVTAGVSIVWEIH